MNECGSNYDERMDRPPEHLERETVIRSITRLLEQADRQKLLDIYNLVLHIIK